MERPTRPLPKTLSAAIQELLRGQDSAKKLRDLLSAVRCGALKPLKQEEEGGGGGQTAGDLISDVLRSFTSTLSILNCGDSDEVSQVPPMSRCNGVKSEESEESSKTPSPAAGRRGCYKRRKSSDSWTKLSPNFADDGHQWRKYGQKSIHSTKFPRSYFRCTHKLDQGCQAKKQVQQISDDPPVFRTLYHGKHTCRNLLKAPQIILAGSSPLDSNLLSFKTDYSIDPPSHGNNNIGFSCSNAPSTTVKSVAEEGTVMNYVNRLGNPSSSSEYEHFTSSDFTLFGSAISSSHGDTLSSRYSFDRGMDLMDGVDFQNMLACHFT